MVVHCLSFDSLINIQRLNTMNKYQDLRHYHNRLGPANKLGRIAWILAGSLLMRSVPKVFPAWHRFVLRLFGAHVGKRACVAPSVRVWAPWNLSIGDNAWIGPSVDLYSVGAIIIGNDAVISHEATLCTASHNCRDPEFPLIVKPIKIAPEAWVAARAFVGPGVTLGDGAVLGAMSVAMHDVPTARIFVGNPARDVGPRVPLDPDSETRPSVLL